MSLPREQCLNPFDTAEAIGIEVRFVDAPSLEGMFSREPHPLVLLPSLHHRPRGRVSYTCGHELGHALLGHGDTVDHVIHEEQSSSAQEFAANVFSSSLLMPRPAVLAGLERRQVDVTAAPSIALYSLACELNVGYETLLQHLSWGLRLTDAQWLRKHRQTTPKDFRAQLAASEAKNLLVVDAGWLATPLDCETGDAIVIADTCPLEMDNGVKVLSKSEPQDGWLRFRAERPGETWIGLNRQRIRVRVARVGYCGPYRNRYLDDPETS